MIIGTERHESRRIDNQLRGRAGRQGDPGETRFFISLEDDIMRLFGSERILGMVNALGMPDDEPIEHNMLTNAIENAQKRVEGRNFQIRKHVLQYDDVMNKQREVIYSERQRVLNGDNIKDSITKMLEQSVDSLVETYCAGGEYADFWNMDAILEFANQNFAPAGVKIEFTKDDYNFLTVHSLRNILSDYMHERYEEKEKLFGDDLREAERVVLLNVVDEKWMRHIDDMDQLRKGIGLRAYGQKDPVIEYQFEGYNMFDDMIKSISNDTAKILLNLVINNRVERKQIAVPLTASVDDGSSVKKPIVKKTEKIGRNDPCPCGSGKKYKKCCGFNSEEI